jgi:hypothetical protein
VVICARVPALEASPHNAFLEQARIFYDEFEFAKCLVRLEDASKVQRTSEEDLIAIEVLSGLCSYNLGRIEAAEDHFRLALRLDPSAQLPAMTSPKIVALFEDVRDRLPPSKAEEPPPKPELSATPVEADHGIGARTIALGVASLAALGGAIYFGVDAKRLERSANNAVFDSDAAGWGHDAEVRASISNGGLVIAALLAVGAGVSYWLDASSP